MIVAVDCKRYTVKEIEISGNQTGNMSEIFRTTKDTQRYDNILSSKRDLWNSNCKKPPKTEVVNL